MTLNNAMMSPIKKILLLLCLMVTTIHYCHAIDHSDKFLSLAKLPTSTMTRDKVIGICGKPERVEDTKKVCRWYYSNDNSKLVIHWNNRSGAVERFAFNYTTEGDAVFDHALEQKLKEGILDITQALKLLGTPKDLLIKGPTQVMHYTFQKSVLRLFFRNRTLVDYSLTGCGN